MAPGGIEPPHAGSKPAALSTELRGRAKGQYARHFTVSLPAQIEDPRERILDRALP
jgi:hypothetical protein